MTKTNTEKSRDRRARLRAEGYKEIRNLWTKPEHEDAIKRYAAALNATQNSED